MSMLAVCRPPVNAVGAQMSRRALTGQVGWGEMPEQERPLRVEASKKETHESKSIPNAKLHAHPQRWQRGQAHHVVEGRRH